MNGNEKYCIEAGGIMRKNTSLIKVKDPKEKKRYGKVVKWISIVVCLLVLSGIVACYLVRSMPLGKMRIKTLIDSNWEEAMIVQEEQPRYLEKLSQEASYKIESIDNEEGYYIVTVIVSAPDLKGYFIDNSVDMLTNIDDLDTFVCECIEKSDSIETTAEVYVYELDGGVSVSYSDTFVDAMHGGIISYSQEMLRNLYLDYFEGGLE